MGRALPWLAASCVVWAIVCSAACSLSALDGFSAGGPLVPDGSLDDAGADGTAPGDAGVNKAAEGGAKPALTCPPNALVCDDFEHAGALAERWDVFGTPTVSTKQFVSAGHSLELSMVEDQDAPVLVRTLGAPSGDAMGHTKLSLDVYAGQNANGFLELCKLAFGPSNDWDTLILAIDPGGLNADLQSYVNSSGPTDSTGQVLVPALTFYGQGWFHIDVKIDLDSSTKSAAFTVNGETQTHMLQNAHATPQEAKLFVGFSYGNTTIDNVFVDNVVFTTQ